jgi:hypothetical protein
MKRKKPAAKVTSLGEDPIKSLAEANRERILKLVKDDITFKQVFKIKSPPAEGDDSTTSTQDDDDEDDNNAIMLHDYAIFLRTINSVRKKCLKMCMCWTEEGLYVIIFENVDYEKNVFFFSKDTVPMYRFNGKPRYYYITPRDMAIATTGVSPDSILIINEKMTEDDEGAFTSYKGSGKEVLEFHTFSKLAGVGTDMTFDMVFDRTTSGILPENYWDDETFCELDYIKLVKPGAQKWDIVTSTVSPSDIIAKKILKSEEHTCSVIYDNDFHNFKFEIDTVDGKINFTLKNDLQGLKLKDPVGFIQHIQQRLRKEKSI